MKTAIIGGAGKMGQWLAHFLSKEGKQVVITGRNREKLRAVKPQPGVEIAPSNIDAVNGADYILLSVSLENLEEVLKEISPSIKQGQVVVDITSVKVAPVALMHRYAKKATVLGAHPLFGPGAASIAHQNIVLTPTSENENKLAQKIKGYLEARGARVMLMTPPEHDEAMSLVLGLSHFIAIVSADAILSSGKTKAIGAVSSTTYKVLLTMIQSVLSEDPELYAGLQMSLPRAADFERLFQTKVGEWVGLVAAKDKPEFVRRMKDLKSRLEEVSPDFGKAYEKMYRIVEGL